MWIVESRAGVELFVQEDTTLILSTHLSQRWRKDELYWRLSKYGVYTVKSGYWFAKMGQSIMIGWSDSLPKDGKIFGILMDHQNYNISYGGLVKINTDAHIVEGVKLGLGVVICDNQGKLTQTATEIGQVTSPEIAEAMSVRSPGASGFSSAVVDKQQHIGIKCFYPTDISNSRQLRCGNFPMVTNIPYLIRMTCVMDLSRDCECRIVSKL
ncbi:hypothetical protein POM88_027993 [Heracleum sosnowskyi]|uniref:Uncharacterized protein n=1 Tax=Heracleum sosnowskyi TaxID=360622 RepID=A0AAD8I8V9_9APIA|nr:hypothetical protein POM88_027993 [Heracleum sosnowskyi]